MFAKLLALLTHLDYPRVIRHQVLNHLNFGTHIKKPDSMNHVKLIEFHKDSANCKAFVKDYNSLAKTVCSLQPLSHPTEAWRRHALGPEAVATTQHASGGSLLFRRGCA